LWSLPVSRGRPRALVASPGTDVDGQFSPDGRWLAYSSDVSGRWETYVTPANAQGAALPISSGGGLEARWRRDGRELFYLSLDNALMAVDVQPGPRLVLGVPRRLFVAPVGSISTGRNHYDVGPEGQRFLVTEEIRTGAPLAITVLTDWRAATR
jgi:dipeptidyl aminopeptidase/acylaminoacyl peptidase